MGGCESVPEEEVYEPRRRRYRQRTPIMYTRPLPPPPQQPVMQMPMHRYPQMPMAYTERRYPMPAPVIDGPVYGGYRRYEDDYDDYDDGYYDRGRQRYSYHSYTR